MDRERFDLVVIGGGPGGYVAAIRAAQLGKRVACVEKEAQLGGTCLRIGCIPSKALLESSERYRMVKEGLGVHGITVGDVSLDLAAMMARKDKIVNQLTRGVASLFKKHNITRYQGHATFENAGRVTVTGGEPITLEADAFLIATGSKSAPLPGVQVDGDRVGTSTEALAYPEVPGHLVVIGAGYVGLELGSVWHRLGAKVTVLEYFDRILPGMDAETASEALKIFLRQGLEFRLSSKVTGARAEGDGCVVETEGNPLLHCDRVLVAAGRVPYTEDLGLESVGITTDARGRIPVDDRFATEVPGIYAIGDVIRGPMLAHKAMEEGVAFAERLYNGYGQVDYNAIPGIVYTEPEIASVGRSEEELEKAGIPYRKGIFPFRPNGRALALGETDGRVKILADERTDRILGAHIIGPRAGDLIAELATAMAFHSSSEDITLVPHAHPTLSEAVKEAALGVLGRQIHL